MHCGLPSHYLCSPFCLDHPVHGARGTSCKAHMVIELFPLWRIPHFPEYTEFGFRHKGMLEWEMTLLPNCKVLNAIFGCKGNKSEASTASSSGLRNINDAKHRMPRSRILSSPREWRRCAQAQEILFAMYKSPYSNLCGFTSWQCPEAWCFTEWFLTSNIFWLSLIGKRSRGSKRGGKCRFFPRCWSSCQVVRR